MMKHSELSDVEVRIAIRHKKIVFAGNKRLKIYGLLNCSSGKRMKKENRIFFNFEEQAIAAGYRPCGHCLTQQYKVWKNGGSV